MSHFLRFRDGKCFQASQNGKRGTFSLVSGAKIRNSTIIPMQSDFGCSRQQWLDSICTKCWHYWEGNCSKTNYSTVLCSYRNLHFCTSKSNCFPLTRQKNAVIQRTFVPTYTWFFSSLLLWKVGFCNSNKCGLFLWQALINSKLNNHTRPMQSNFGCSRQC